MKNGNRPGKQHQKNYKAHHAQVSKRAVTTTNQPKTRPQGFTPR